MWLFINRVFQSNVLASVCATYPAHLKRLNLIAEDFISLEVHLFFFSNIHNVRFEILTAVLVKIQVFWEVTQCRLVYSCRRFEVDMA